MIIRITTEGQYNLPGSFVDELNDIDNELVEAVESADRSGFDGLLKKMLDVVREKGSPLPVDELVESDLILPTPDTTLEEAQILFVGEGRRQLSDDLHAHIRYLSPWLLLLHADQSRGRYAVQPHQVPAVFLLWQAGPKEQHFRQEAGVVRRVSIPAGQKQHQLQP